MIVSRNYLTLVCILFLAIDASAQLHRHTWYFGGSDPQVGAGIQFDFTTNQPSPVSNRYPLQLFENNIIVADQGTGQVYFYSDGQKVVDRNHEVMPNGDGLFGHESAQYGTAVVQDPNSCPGTYYLFYVQADEQSGDRNLYYSVVDNSLPGNGSAGNPRGDIVSGKKNIQVNPAGLNCGEGLLTIPKAEPSKESWLIFVSRGRLTLHVYDVSASGVSEAHVYNLRDLFPGFPNFGLKACRGLLVPETDKQGKLILSTGQGNNNLPLGHFDFNLETGAIDASSYVEIDPGISWVYGMTLSPDQSKFYYTDYFKKTLVQYDFATQTRTIIGTSPHSGRSGGLERGPDGKLYWSNVYSHSGFTPITHLAVVHKPNELGTACELQFDAWEIRGNNNPVRLGAMPVFATLPTPPSASLIAPVACGNLGSAQVNPNSVASPFNVRWDNGETTVTATQLSQGNHQVTITSGGGCEYVASVFVPENSGGVDPSSFTIQTTDPATCNNGDEGQLSIQTNGAFPANMDYSVTYEQNGSTVGPVVLTTDANGNLQINGPVGTYNNMTITDANLGCDYELTGPWEINFPNMSQPDISVADFCPGEPLQFQVSNTLAGATFNWSGPNGFSSDLANPLVSSSAAALHEGTYSLTVTQNGCELTGLQVVIEQVESSIEMGQDIDTCAGMITLAVPAGFSNIQWSNGVQGSTAEVTSSGVIEVQGENVNGCLVSDNLNVQLLPVPEVELGADIHICPGEPLEVTLSGPSGMSEYLWSTGATSEQIVVQATGTYTLEVMQGRCKGADTITIHQAPEQSLNLGSDTTLCEGTKIVLAANQEFEQYLWSTGSTDSQIEVDFGGTFWLETTDAFGCTFRDTLELTTVLPPEVSIDTDTTILLGGQTTLATNAGGGSGNLAYLWSPDARLSCNDCPEPLASPVDNTLYTVTVTDERGCTASASFLLEVDKERRVYIPNVFSPNEDGNNDFFRLFADARIERIKTMQIFNRWGALMFQSTDARHDDLKMRWDGSFKGEIVNAGVYFYNFEVVFIDGHVQQFAGDISVVK